VALRCTKCGAVLPRDDARSCNNCGTLISPRPAHPTLTAVPKGETDSPPGSKPGLPQVASMHKGSIPPLREQIAQQPPARPVRLVTPDEVSPPAGKWEGQDKLDRAQAPVPGEEEKVELRDTIPLAAPVKSGPITPIPSVPPMSQQTSTEEVRWEQGLLQRQHVKENVVSSVAFSPHPIHRWRRTPLHALSVLFPLLIIVGLGIWIVKFQPFSVSAVTQPQQSFKDANLGLSLLYPTGWMAQVDHAQSTIHFYDSSHTAEVMIAVKDAATGKVAQYLQQQVTQLGMTGAKAGTPFSFAGATWQSVQGSLQLSGANYTGTLLATVHRGRLFGFIQLAPQSIYADEEKLVFADMRSSLQFV
jgi:hypothetical protein